MNIEKCVVFIATQQPQVRIDHREVDVIRRAVVSLPRLKCLEELLPGEKKKYYLPEELKIEMPKKDASTSYVRTERTINQLSRPLTKREKQVKELYDSGMKAEQIADHLGLTLKAARGWISQIQRKILAHAQKGIPLNG